MANTLEALIGAIYLDSGFEQAKQFVDRNVLVKLTSVMESGKILDPKSKFQEITQAQFGITPNYRVTKEWGPPHARRFISTVYLKKKKVAQGEGKSKKEAEEDAARAALIAYEETKNPSPISFEEQE